MSFAPAFEEPSPLPIVSGSASYLLYVDRMVEELESRELTPEAFVELYWETRKQVFPPRLDLVAEAAQ